MSGEVRSVDFDGIREETFTYRDWAIISRKSHILHSKCVYNCDQLPEASQKCLFCKYSDELDLPHFPDMTYAKNLLRLEHNNGYGFEFSCLSALKNIEKSSESTKVSVSEEWLKSRSGSDGAKNIQNHFNWTFTTTYMGDLFSSNDGVSLVVEETNDRIDINKLKKKEEILFYDDIHLFEDELADNGVSQCTVKIRVMKERFFILLRYYLRVDNVLAKIFDTRYYYEANNDYLLREHTRKEESLKNTSIPSHVLFDPVELNSVLPVLEFSCHKLSPPSA